MMKHFIINLCMDVHETLKSRDRDETRQLKTQVETRRDETFRLAYPKIPRSRHLKT